MMLYEILKKEIHKYPDSRIRDESNSITYAELLLQAENLGKRLNKPKYGIRCKSELYTAIAILACFYAKSTAVLLPFRYGSKHNQKIIEKMKVSHLITENGIVVLEGEVEETEDLSEVALIMSTSGTTGCPKGAMLTYENLWTNLQDIQAYFDIKASDRILIARPLYHCAVLTGEFLVSLTKGLDIIFLNKEFNPVTILQTVRKYGITVFCGTPTMFYYLCGVTGRQVESLPFKTLAVSGECMTERVANRLRKTFSTTNIYHVYGQTEAGPRVSYLPPEFFQECPLSVGFPVKSVQIKIEDGELLAKGKNIMRGYYDDPVLTKKILVNGWLHTGDMAILDEQGRITIKGRKDNLIIRAGMNIYPQEMENALMDIEHIFDVLVYGVKKETVGENIVLKVVTDTLTKSEIFVYCRRLFAPCQLPDIIEIVDKIPRNASGKVIRGDV